MQKIVIYGHGSSKNHGCEAIVKTTSKMLKNVFPDAKICLSTLDYDNDCKCFPLVDDYIKNRTFNESFLLNCLYYLNYKICPKKSLSNFLRYSAFRKSIKKMDNNSFFISAGGDNYCTSYPGWLYNQNKKIDKKGFKRILWGASIEPYTNDRVMMEDLNGYSSIFARETITYDSLLEKGYSGRLYLHPDPAFTLETDLSKVPSEMNSKKWIGINLSPVIMNSETKKGVAFESYSNLINYILNNTDFNIALIPHVVIDGNSDFKAMEPLFDSFNSTGRVIRIPDNLSASQYKGIISKCEMFIGARTHATIAAYSNEIPTLVIGYSVKAKGIAKDIFGDYTDYVLPVQEITEAKVLTDVFIKALERIDSDKEHLKKVIPDFIKRSKEAEENLKKEILM